MSTTATVRRFPGGYRARVLAVVAALAVYTVLTVTVPALQFAWYSPDSRIVLETLGLTVSLFTAMALMLPEEGDAAPPRGAFVAALVPLGVSNAVFGVLPFVLSTRIAGGASSFYPWLTSRYLAAILFIVAGVGRPRLGVGRYLMVTFAALAAIDVVVLVVGDGLPVPEGVPGTGVPIDTDTIRRGVLVAIAPAVLFAVAAWLSFRVFARTYSRIHLWLTVALCTQVFTQLHEVLYPAVLGPVITSADVLRILVLLLLLCGAVLKVRRLFVDRGAALVRQSEELATQRELMQAMTQFAEREETFRSMVVHELATPIATLRAFAHVLGRHVEQAPPEVRQAQRAITTESGRLQRLVDRMEELRSIEDPDLRLERSPVRLRPLLEELARYVSGLPGDHHAIVDSDDVRVHVDPVRLGQALRNIVTNAVTYAPDGSPILMTGQVCPDGRVEIAVEDRGPGIPADDRAGVLRKYGRGRRHDGGGAGLGLYLAERIARAHGGELRIDDGARGSGTRVALLVERAT